MTAADAYDLSVIITAYNARHTVRACLASLDAQRTAHRFEILFVDSGSDGTAELVAAEFPHVRLFRSKKRLYAGDGRNLAIPQSGAPLIAFLDADCHVEPDWVDAVLAAQERPNLVAAGAVHNGSTASLTGWAYYFCEFNLWAAAPGAPAREIDEAAGCSLSMKREAFACFGPFPGGSYSSDSAFARGMQEAGHRVLFWPAARVYHHYDGGLRDFLEHQALHRRGYAAVLCRQRGLSRWGRLGRILGLPWLPGLLSGALVYRLDRTPGLFRPLAGAAPLVWLSFCARAWGEFTGYLRPGEGGD
jgi:GT2 family glycosyltransferase